MPKAEILFVVFPKTLVGVVADGEVLELMLLFDFLITTPLLEVGEDADETVLPLPLFNVDGKGFGIADDDDDGELLVVDVDSVLDGLCANFNLSLFSILLLPFPPFV